MFTGIIEEMGTIQAIRNNTSSSQLTISANVIFEDMKIGDSIAVNGVCLTVTSMRKNSFMADVMPETMRRTCLGGLKIGDEVNLERAMAANGRFGGHIVSGHIDGIGTIQAWEKEENAVWITIATTSKLLYYIIEKGSITIDGISLTVAYVDESVFKVSIIPHTAGNTTLLKKRVKDIVNLECDIIGKYVEKLLGIAPQNLKEDVDAKKNGISETFLMEHGFM